MEEEDPGRLLRVACLQYSEDKQQVVVTEDDRVQSRALHKHAGNGVQSCMLSRIRVMLRWGGSIGAALGRHANDANEELGMVMGANALPACSQPACSLLLHPMLFRRCTQP